MSYIFYIILLAFLLILSQGILAVDEEMILIISVLLFLGSSYNAISGFLVSSLSDRAETIKKLFDNFFILKINTLTTLLGTYQKVYDTNVDLINVIGITAAELQTVREARNKEVDYFINFIVNNQLNIILSEEIQLLRVLYYNKVKSFFQVLLTNWKLYEVRGLVNEEISSFNIFEEFDKSSSVINDNKLALLPLSSMGLTDYNLFSKISKIKSFLDYIFLVPNFVSTYILINLLLGVKSLSLK